MITTVKYIADIDNPTVPTGYLVDGEMNVPIEAGNRHYQEVQEWMVDTENIVEPAFTFEEIQLATMGRMIDDVSGNKRPRVFVPLDDGVTEIYIWGSREDQFDIGDRYELMKEDSVPNIYLKDADDNMLYLGHLDIKRCYKAITIHRQNTIEYQWTKEAEIMACTTQGELDLVTW